MGDAESALPPSKKRAAGRELSRDNPGLDDEEDVNDLEAGTFKKASEEVLANRRIVKVRRNRTSSAPTAPSSNPFASIQLVPPTNPASTPVAVTSVQKSEDNAKEETVKEEDEGGEEVESKVTEVENHEVDSEAKKLESADAESAKEEETVKEKDGASQEPESKVEEVENHGVVGEAEKVESADAESAKEEAECEAKKTESKEVEDDENKKTATVSSFQQLSSTQNAFTGIVGTGFSSSSFSFGPITKGDTPSFPSFSFGTNGNSSLFGSVSDNTEGTKTPSIKQVEVETGEENEKAVFTADSILFEFIDGGWKERGKGEIKVNVSTAGNEKGRLVMRAKGNYRLILNASLFPDMKLTNMEKKGITFACVNSNSEGKDGLSTFALKFKDAAIVEEFRVVVTQHKGVNTNSNTNAAVPSLKTPENSP